MTVIPRAITQEATKAIVVHLSVLPVPVLAPALPGGVTLTRAFYLTFCIYTGMLKIELLLWSCVQVDESRAGPNTETLQLGTF